VPFSGVMKDGIFLREAPLGSVLSGYSNSGTAVAAFAEFFENAFLSSIPLRARLLDHGKKPARQFVDAIRLMVLQSFLRQNFSSNADGAGASEDVVERRQLVDASRHDQRNLRQRHFEGAYIMNAAGGCGGKDLYKIRPRLPRGDDFGGRERAGKHSHIRLPGIGETSGMNPGLVMKRAPAATHRSAARSSSTVPAPTINFGYRLARSSTTSGALVKVRVISTTGIPAANRVSAANRACSGFFTRAHGMIPISSIP